jgi:hypothetical protein
VASPLPATAVLAADFSNMPPNAALYGSITVAGAVQLDRLAGAELAQVAEFVASASFDHARPVVFAIGGGNAAEARALFDLARRSAWGPVYLAKAATAAGAVLHARIEIPLLVGASIAALSVELEHRLRDGHHYSVTSCAGGAACPADAPTSLMLITRKATVASVYVVSNRLNIDIAFHAFGLTSTAAQMHVLRQMRDETGGPASADCQTARDVAELGSVCLRTAALANVGEVQGLGAATAALQSAGIAARDLDKMAELASRETAQIPKLASVGPARLDDAVWAFNRGSSKLPFRVSASFRVAALTPLAEQAFRAQFSTERCATWLPHLAFLHAELPANRTTFTTTQDAEHAVRDGGIASYMLLAAGGWAQLYDAYERKLAHDNTIICARYSGNRLYVRESPPAVETPPMQL